MLGVKKKRGQEEKLTFFKGSWVAVELLGSGAYGKVYKAKKDEFGISTVCAIKRIEIPQSDAELHDLRTEGMTKKEITEYLEDTVKKWVEEIKFMANFKDSLNIVNIEDYEVIEKESGNGYIIHIRMELLKNLEDYTLENNITDKEILKMAIDVCSALEDCEKNDVLHRDIKPGNIFVNKKGVFKLGDFGVAKKAQGTVSNLSKKGTENYMAPELYKNERGNRTVDIYSLGIMLYRYFNYNRLPFLPDYPSSVFSHDREEAIYKRISGDKMSPPKNASREISEIILKACNYYPKDRYQSATDLKKDLEIVYNNLKKETILFDFDSCKMEKIYKENSKSLNKEEEFEKTVPYRKNKEEKLDEVQEENVIVENEIEEDQEVKEIQLEKNDSINKKSLKKKEEVKIKDPFLVKLKSKRKMILLFIIFILLGGSIWFLSRPEDSIKIEEKLVVMPYLIDKSSEDATSILEKLKLEVEYEYQEVEDESKIGFVLEQLPKKETELKEGTLVKIKVAVSKEKVEVISVVGLSIEDATTKLQEQELQIQVTEQYSDTVEVGKVISQMPIEGEMVYKNSIVEVLISLGPEPTVTPEATPIPTKIPVVKNWSNWVTSLPSHVNKNNYYIETKTEYRYQDKETTTSTNPNLSGWTKYNEEVSYSDWGTNKTTTNSITESDTVKIVSSQKKYTYYHWKNWYDGMWNVDSIKWGSNSTYCEFSTVWDMPNINFADKGGKQMVGSIDGCGDGMQGWFKKGSFVETTYQSRTKTITYYFYKWGNWSEWSESQVTGHENKQVETRMFYRYKQK